MHRVGKEAPILDERVWFEQLYNQYADFLFRIGRRLLSGRDDSVLYDAIQEVYLTLWNKRAELAHHPNIGGWLVEALKLRLQVSNRKLTRQRAHTAYSLNDDEHAVPLEDRVTLSPEQSAILQSHIAQLCALLGEEQAQLFLDYTVYGYRAKDLSAKYGISPSCIWVRIARIKKKLAEHPESFYVFIVLLSGFSTLHQ